MTHNCSAINCKEVGTQFDGATIELFACKDHETKWRNQMIDLGVSCLNNYAKAQRNPICTALRNCYSYGYYYVNGVGYCSAHAKAGSMGAYVTDDGNVVKMMMRECENDHKIMRWDNCDDNCFCGKKLKSLQ